MTGAGGSARPGPASPIAAALMATVEAVAAAATRRSLDSDPAWLSVSRVLSEWAFAGDSAGGGPDPDEGAGPDAGTDPEQPGPGAFDDPLDRIAAVFRLDAVAADLLLVIAAPDIDPNMAAAYGLLIGASAPRPATVALALELAGVSTVSPLGRAALGPAGPLRRWGLVSVGEGPWSLGRSLTAGDDVIGALLGGAVPEPVSAAMTVDGSEVDELSEVGGAAELTAALAAGAGLCWVEDPPGAAGVAACPNGFRERRHPVRGLRSGPPARRRRSRHRRDRRGQAGRVAGQRRGPVVGRGAGRGAGGGHRGEAAGRGPGPGRAGRQLPLEPRLAPPASGHGAGRAAAARQPDRPVASGDQLPTRYRTTRWRPTG